MLSRMASVEDLRARARRRLPHFAFDFFDGGAETESNLRRNRAAFEAVTLQPRALVDVSKIDTSVCLFGQDYALPFGVAPMGFLNLAWPGTDLALARLAAEKRMPIGASTAASTSLEAIAEAAEGHAWFQLYVSTDKDWVSSLLDRAWAAGFRVLLLTVDSAKPGKRDRDIRNGLQIPFRPTLGHMLDLARHPRWSLATLKAGLPRFANAVGPNSPFSSAIPLTELQRRMISDSFDWEDLKRLRSRWKGSLVLKGLLNPDDSRLAVAAGCDGIMVSNHGGRQIDYGPTSLEVLPAIRDTVKGRAELLIDSGIRRGADLIRAKAYGASMALLGRPFAYGAGAGGADGCRQAAETVETELTRALGQLGVVDFNRVDESLVLRGSDSWAPWSNR
ncbi:MAG: alpha-hydroxy-acid oxidizing protein [Rhodospirillales bacterium]|nr:alpha-hydroxy-acid oxidizing protein [Rhodospirillales bacterium]